MHAILLITTITLFSTLNQDVIGFSLGKEDNSFEIQLKNEVKQYLEKLNQIKSQLDKVPQTIDEEVQRGLVKTTHLTDQCRNQASYQLDQVKNLAHQNITSCQFYQNMYNITEKLIHDGEYLALSLFETTFGTASLFVTCFFASPSLNDFAECEKYDFIFAARFFIYSIQSAVDLVVDGVEYPAKTAGFVWSCFRRDVMESTVQNVIDEAFQCHQNYN